MKLLMIATPFVAGVVLLSACSSSSTNEGDAGNGGVDDDVTQTEQVVLTEATMDDIISEASPDLTLQMTDPGPFDNEVCVSSAPKTGIADTNCTALNANSAGSPHPTENTWASKMTSQWLVGPGVATASPTLSVGLVYYLKTAPTTPVTVPIGKYTPIERAKPVSGGGALVAHAIDPEYGIPESVTALKDEIVNGTASVCAVWVVDFKDAAKTTIASDKSSSCSEPLAL